ncbi:MAG: tol-pal system protein YbgF [Nitrospira sp. BO4]|jgi:tol-pal system protein YbgF|nr:tol-pal system protein YbgF [Nitrospira sp. BO4]
MSSLTSNVILTTFILFGSPVVASEADETPTSSGTGIAVSHQGHILTNYHVIANCPSIRVVNDGKQTEVTVIATDTKNDLALVKLSQTLTHVARFREGRGLRSGDSIVVVGFPLHSLLAAEANVTTGTVSALAGLGNDTRLFQITAPVQPGNSGGPLLDKSGQVVGVVESKLNALAMALLTGDIPQNINFAIKDVVARSFMDSHNIRYEKSASASTLEPADIGEAAKRFTFLLKCYPQSPKGAQFAALEAERHALGAERRALETERQVLEEERRKGKEANTGYVEVNKHRGIDKSTGPRREEVEAQTTIEPSKTEPPEKERQAEHKEADKHSLRLQQEKQAREAIKEARRQVLSEELVTREEARRKIQEARLLTVPMEQGKTSANVPIPSPTPAFNHAYNDYMNGKYALAATGFRRFIQEFAGMSLIPSAHYWLAESYYNLKEYGKAIQVYDHLVTEYPGSEKTSPALYRLGMALAETRQLDGSRKTFLRLIEEFPSSAEAALAKTRLLEMP